MDDEQMRRVIDEAFPPEERARQRRELHARTKVVGQLDQAEVLKAFEGAGYSYIREKPAKKTDLTGEITEVGDMYVQNDCPVVPDETHGGGAVLIFWDNGDSGFSCRGGRCQESRPSIFTALEAIDVDPATLFVEDQPGEEGTETTTAHDADEEDNEIGFHWASGQPDVRARKELLEGIIPVGAIAFVGRYDQGKTTAAKTIAALTTTGALLGDYRGVPQIAFISSFEEDWDADILPTLTLAGANLDLVVNLDPRKASGENIAIWLAQAVERAEAERGGVRAGIIVLDGIKDFMRGQGDNPDWDSFQVRQFLTPIQRFSRSRELATIMVAHPRKDSLNGEISGSAAWSEVPRTVIRVTRTKLEVAKSNFGHRGNSIGIVGESGIVNIVDGKGVKAWWTRLSIADATPVSGSGGEAVGHTATSPPVSTTRPFR
jgi:hypothetical protein